MSSVRSNLNCLLGIIVSFSNVKIIATLIIVRSEIKINSPERLKYFDTIGPIIKALKNAAPMATPTIAIDNVLFFTDVLSDNNAISTPDIAPAPCRALPSKDNKYYLSQSKLMIL